MYENISFSSKSTEKLAIMMEGIAQWPPEAFTRIKSATISWDSFSDCVVPTLNMEYFEKV